MEITDKVKLIQMSVLMKSDKPKRSKNEFQSLLETVPVDLVRGNDKYLFQSGPRCNNCKEYKTS